MQNEQYEQIVTLLDQELAQIKSEEPGLDDEELSLGLQDIRERLYRGMVEGKKIEPLLPSDALELYNMWTEAPPEGRAIMKAIGRVLGKMSPQGAGGLHEGHHHEEGE